MRWTRHKKKVYTFLGICLILTLFFTWYNLHHRPEGIEVSLSYCIDGDTMIFQDEEREFRVRLLSVDCPELEEEYGEEAREFSLRFLEGKRVFLIEEPGSKYDKYGRELYWVYVDEELLQEKLLEEGLAKIEYVYEDYDLLGSLEKAEKKAKSENRGIWSK